MERRVDVVQEAVAARTMVKGNIVDKKETNRMSRAFWAALATTGQT